MTIAVLIATCNRTDMLRTCLELLLANDRRPDEIVVADQGDDNSTREMLGQLDAGQTAIKYEHLVLKGKSNALNHAIRKTECDVIALTDDDVLPPSDWLDAIATVVEAHEDVGAFCGRVLPEEGTNPDDYLNLVLDAEPFIFDKSINPISPSFVGADMAIRRQVLIDVGCYNEAFGPGSRLRSNEDGELAYRLIRAGVKIRHSPEMLVYHSGWRGETENVDLLFDYAFGIGALAGYCRRGGDWPPSWYLARKLFYRVRQWLYGFFFCTPRWRDDARLHLRAFIAGYREGRRDPDEPAL